MGTWAVQNKPFKDSYMYLKRLVCFSLGHMGLDVYFVVNLSTVKIFPLWATEVLIMFFWEAN